MSGHQIPLQQVFLNTVAKMRQKIGLARQLMVDTETWRLYLHDGVTKGGHPLKKLDDPTEEIRTIPFRGPDPVAGETWVMGEWPSDEDPQVNELAYVAGVYAEHELTDEDIANATSQKGLVSGEQLSALGGGNDVYQLTDEDIANGTSESGTVSGEQLAGLGYGGGEVWDLPIRDSEGNLTSVPELSFSKPLSINQSGEIEWKNENAVKATSIYFNQPPKASLVAEYEELDSIIRDNSSVETPLMFTAVVQPELGPHEFPQISTINSLNIALEVGTYTEFNFKLLRTGLNDIWLGLYTDDFSIQASVGLGFDGGDGVGAELQVDTNLALIKSTVVDPEDVTFGIERTTDSLYFIMDSVRTLLGAIAENEVLNVLAAADQHAVQSGFDGDIFGTITMNPNPELSSTLDSDTVALLHSNTLKEKPAQKNLGWRLVWSGSADAIDMTQFTSGSYSVLAGSLVMFAYIEGLDVKVNSGVGELYLSNDELKTVYVADGSESLPYIKKLYKQVVI